jgi:hypothetical protein
MTDIHVPPRLSPFGGPGVTERGISVVGIFAIGTDGGAEE